MHLLKIMAAFLLIATTTFTFAQKSPKKFGNIDKKSLEMSYTSLDSTAGAVVLFDYGYTTFDHNFEISFERHIRIKILNSSEFDQGDVKIIYAANDRVERLKAATYNLENGKIVEHDVSRRDMFDGTYHMHVVKKDRKLMYYRRLKMNKGKYSPEQYGELVDFFKEIKSADSKKAILLSKT